MVSKEIQEEIEYARKEVLDAPNNMALSNDGIMMQIERASSRLLDLIRLCIGEKEIDYAMDLCEETKSYVKQIVEFKFGASFREASDYVVQHSDVKDTAYDLYWNITLEQTPYRFEPFMFYMEKNRPFAKKFYEPRRYTKSGKPAMIRVAKVLEEAGYGKYKTVAISLPSRCGKSTIFIFFLCWNALRHPNSHSAYGGYSGVLAKGFYKEIMNLLTSSEYTYEEIYRHYNPTMEFIRDKSAEDFSVTLGDTDRFATITTRGIDGSWTGIIDVSADGGVLAVDDLIRDRQHSLSPTRMEETWQEYLNKMVDRKNVGAIEVLIGTLWSVLDPIERLRIMHEGDPRYCFLRIPALDENDESNFDYEINGFTTEYYREMRERLDPAEWQAKFQQRPFVREGLLFPTDELKYFDGIINRNEIKRTIAVCDPSFGGGDNLSMPICIELENGRKLIASWIYDKGTIKKTIPRIVSAIKKFGISELRVEKTGAGMMLSDAIKDEMKKQDVICCKVIAVSAPNRISKEDKIIGYSDYIKTNFEFLIPNQNYDPTDSLTPDSLFFKRDIDYNRAMDDVGMFVCEGKNPHDDAPDSLAQLAIMYENKRNGQINVIHIPDGFGI